MWPFGKKRKKEEKKQPFQSKPEREKLDVGEIAEQVSDLLSTDSCDGGSCAPASDHSSSDSNNYSSYGTDTDSSYSDGGSFGGDCGGGCDGGGGGGGD